MNILITGGSGLVGRHIYQALQQQAFMDTLVATHFTYALPETVYLDLLQPLPDWVTQVYWDVIIHAGAMTQVDACESREAESYAATVQTTVSLLQLAANSGALLVYLSTDYVFDGQAGPYTEEAVPHPLNVYGRHKLTAEQLVCAYEHHLVLRITNVYGTEARNKNFIARLVQQLEKEEQVEVIAPVDQYATPVNAADIARAVVLLIRDERRGVYHIAGTDYLSRAQLLQRVARYYPGRIHIRYVPTAALAQPAQRPLRAGLLAAKFMAAYPEFVFSNVDDYLKTVLYVHANTY